MMLKLKTGPSLEPVSSTEAKLFLKVDDATDDTLIAALITAARKQAEEYTGRAFITQTWEMFIDGVGVALPPELMDAYEEMFRTEYVPPSLRAIELPRPPLQSVSSVKCYDDDDTESTWAASNYRVDTYSEPGRIVLAASGEWPTDLRAQQSILVTFISGYGATAADVPEDIKAAMKLMMAHWYEHRESQEMPEEAKRLLNIYRVAML